MLPDFMPRPPPMLAPERDAAWSAPSGLAADARVETAAGPCPAGALLPGALLRTVDGGWRMLRRVTALPAGPTDLLAVAAGVMAEGVPARPLSLCRGQALLIEGAVWPACFLEDGAGVAAYPVALPCVRLETDAPCAFLAEGVACVSDAPSGRPAPDAALARVRAAIGARAGRRYGALEGAVEHVAADGVEGWVRDSAMPGAPVLLALLRDGVTVAHGFADRARPDLAMIGLGACAFRFAMDGPAQDTHLLELRRAEDGAPVPGGMALLRRGVGDPDMPATAEAIAAALAALTRARLRRGKSVPR